MDGREFDEYCIKHGFDPERLDALTTCWLQYSMLDDLKNAEKAKPADAAEERAEKQEP